MHDERIKIKLPNAREKLQNLFPEDNRGDIKIEFQGRNFKLQKAFLRLESTYFKKAFTSNQVTLTINEKFNVLSPSHSLTILPMSLSVFTVSPLKYQGVSALSTIPL